MWNYHSGLPGLCSNYPTLKKSWLPKGANQEWSSYLAGPASRNVVVAQTDLLCNSPVVTGGQLAASIAFNCIQLRVLCNTLTRGLPSSLLPVYLVPGTVSDVRTETKNCCAQHVNTEGSNVLTIECNISLIDPARRARS